MIQYVDEKVIETSKINYFNIHAYRISILKISSNSVEWHHEESMNVL